MPTQLLEHLGLSQKESQVYLTLLQTGPASIRRISSEANINRGTVYESLKKLLQKGIISRSKNKQRDQFIAENPEILKTLFKDERRKLVGLRKELQKSLPKLKEAYNQIPLQPAIKIYEGTNGTRFILEDLLETMKNEKEKEYFVYSSADIRKYLYKDFASFSDRRIAAKIKIKAIAMGAGGELRGFDERRWLTKNNSSPTYIIIYGNKVAMISLGRQKTPIAVLMEDNGLAQTQKLIFEELWKLLK
ncbi:MAG: helix-turn-helix domain-containing protein [Patescibacteria group bacterium]